MDEKTIIDKLSKFGKVGNRDILKNIPEEFRRYKCPKCLQIVDSNPCPNCGETHLEIMCPLDHCHCGHGVVSGIDYCPVCGGAICPTCGTHDVLQLSRVTGYLQDVSGWNEGKKQELKERKRYQAVI